MFPYLTQDLNFAPFFVTLQLEFVYISHIRWSQLVDMECHTNSHQFSVYSANIRKPIRSQCNFLCLSTECQVSRYYHQGGGKRNRKQENLDSASFSAMRTSLENNDNGFASSLIQDSSLIFLKKKLPSITRSISILTDR